MNRNWLLLSAPIIAVAAVGALARISSAGVVVQGEREIEAAARRTRPASIRCALDRKSRSSINKDEVKKRLDAFLEDYNEQTGSPRKHKRTGRENINGFKPEGVMVLYGDPGDDPNAVVEMRVGITLPEGYRAGLRGSGLKVVKVKSPMAVSIEHKGAYSELRQKAPRLARAARIRMGRGGNRPTAIVKLLTDPDETPADQNRSEVILLENSSDDDD